MHNSFRFDDFFLHKKIQNYNFTLLRLFWVIFKHCGLKKCRGDWNWTHYSLSIILFFFQLSLVPYHQRICCFLLYAHHYTKKSMDSDDQDLDVILYKRRGSPPTTQFIFVRKEDSKKFVPILKVFFDEWLKGCA